MRLSMRSSVHLFGTLCLLAGSGVGPVLGGETVRVQSRAELVQAVQQAVPGTTIALAPGTYRGGLHFSRLQGTSQAPIVLAAVDAQHPPVIRGGSSGLHLTDPIYVELRDLVICNVTANGLNIDDGGSYDSPARHVTLRNIVVRDVGPKGNRDGIKLSGLDHFVVAGCMVERWGDSGSAIDMVGCHSGKIHNSTFRFRDDVAANGVQTKGGSAEILIERCRFEHAGSRAVNVGGSTGMPYFRPPAQGYEAKDITVQDCTFVGSRAPIAFVGVDGALVQHNTIYRPTRWVMRILQETSGDSFVPCRNGRFTHNLVVFHTDEVRTVVNVGAGTAPQSFQFAKNHWYCLNRPERSDRLSLPTREKSGVYGVEPRLRDPEQGDLRPALDSPAGKAGVRPEPDQTR